MKSLIIASALFLGLQLSVNAQNSPAMGHMKAAPEKRAEMQTERMATELTLSAEQKKKVYDLNLQSAKKMSALDAKDPASREQIRSIRKQSQEAMKSILSADQFKKYMAVKMEHRQQMQGGGDREDMEK